MDTKITRLASGHLVRVVGHLTGETAPAFQAAMMSALDASVSRVIVDLGEVEYVSSAGLRVLMMAWKRVQAEERFLEIIHARPAVAKVLTVVGLGDLMPMGCGTLQIDDLLKQRNPYNDQALRNAREFVDDLLHTLGVDAARAQRAVEDVFRVCHDAANSLEAEAQLKAILADLRLTERIGESLRDRSQIIHGQLTPYVGAGSILDVGCGDGKVAEAFQDGQRTIQLIDVVDYNRTTLPFQVYDGLHISLPNKSSDYSFLVTVLHHCDDPLTVLRETMRITRKRILVIESVYLNEANRRFNMFFDWFYNRVLHDDVNVPYHFNSPEGWERLFQEEGLTLAASVDIGLDQVTVPEYHWLFALDLPA